MTNNQILKEKKPKSPPPTFWIYLWTSLIQRKLIRRQKVSKERGPSLKSVPTKRRAGSISYQLLTEASPDYLTLVSSAKATFVEHITIRYYLIYPCCLPEESCLTCSLLVTPAPRQSLAQSKCSLNRCWVGERRGGGRPVGTGLRALQRCPMEWITSSWHSLWNGLPVSLALILFSLVAS